MKRFGQLITVILMVLLVLTGCGQKEQEEKQPETPGEQVLIRIETEGLGEIAVGNKADGTPSFEDGHPYTSSAMNVDKDTDLVAVCRAKEDGWTFVKWTKDGADYSEAEQIEIHADKDTVYTAVFVISQSSETVDFNIEDIKVLGDILDLNYVASAYDDDQYIQAFEVNGIVYRAIAKLPADVQQAIDSLDWKSDDCYDKEYELLAPVEITQLENISEHAMTQEEMNNAFAGKTVGEILDEGWEIKSYYYSEDRVDIWKMDNMFCYVLVFDTKYDSNNRDSDSLRDLVVASVEYLGVNDPTDLSIPLD